MKTFYVSEKLLTHLIGHLPQPNEMNLKPSLANQSIRTNLIVRHIN